MAAKKETAVGPVSQSKLRGKHSAELKNNTSTAGTSQTNGRSLLKKSSTEENGNNTNKPGEDE